MSSSSDHAHRPDLQPKESAAGHRMEGSQVAPAPAGPEPVPGEAKTLKSKVLDTGAAVLQRFKPVQGICQHVCAFHCYAHDATRQVRSHHFCSHLNQDFRQCLIYDSEEKGARLIGVEYIIAGHLFDNLPEEEKKYWHSHRYEVTSGQLITPGIPQAAETAECETLVGTYGKTWHFWQVDLGHPLPYGPPQLMMSFTGDGQIDRRLLEERDKEYGVDAAAKRQARAHLAKDLPEPNPAADQPWRTNAGLQTEVTPTGCPFMPTGMPGPYQAGGVSGGQPATASATGEPPATASQVLSL